METKQEADVRSHNPTYGRQRCHSAASVKTVHKFVFVSRDFCCLTEDSVGRNDGHFKITG